MSAGWPISTRAVIEPLEQLDRQRREVMVKKSLVAAICLALAGSVLQPVLAEDLPSRDQQVAAYHEKYDQQFAEILLRINSAESKAQGIPSILKAIKVARDDYEEEMRILANTLADKNATVESADGYAEEEVGELRFALGTIETSLTKVKTIKCVKGKVVKQLREVAPKCPKGFTVKK